MSDWKHEVEDAERALTRRQKKRREKRMARLLQQTNHIGKLKKKRGKSNAENNHKKPRNWTRQNKSFVNYGGMIGMTDAEYEVYIETGRVPERLTKKEQD